MEKIKETNIEKYGAPIWSKSEIGKEILSEIIRSDEVQQKVYNTKKKNKSFNTSKPEQHILELLKSIYPDIEYQYKKDPRYPFYCDYYIPNLDLFIECQGHQGHGFRPYNPDDIVCQEQLQRWINRNEELKQSSGRTSTRYDGMIYCWTIRDPYKRQIAKQNNLNFLEIWPDWDDERILEEIKQFENDPQ